MNNFYRLRIREFFVHLDQYLRLLGNPAVKRRGAVFYGYAKIRLLEKLQPNRTKPVKVLGWHVSYGSMFFLRHLYREIFIERLYARHALDSAAFIIDAGANIGIATLWYKYQYPDARIICIEPDPATFKILQENIRNNNLQNVEARNVAVSDKAGTLEFFYDQSLRGGDVAHSVNRDFRAALDDKPDMASRSVTAEPLRDYVSGPVDILKVDIEGSEVAALASAADLLKKNVRSLQMEYHYLPNNTLAEMLQILDGTGHAYWLHLGEPLENALGQVAMVYSLRQAERAP